jgi:hypothetical protein
LRHKILESYRQKAIEQALRRIDCAGIPVAFENTAHHYTKQNALSWRHDRKAAVEIEALAARFQRNLQRFLEEHLGIIEDSQPPFLL